ncbi:MAG TPA: hypothetical protein VM681_04520 [Candidatus Thermoplasmatota archaeon]|nr:hypothetical protein [Candidatus Thermoplasmatota archaeon]
MTVAIRNWLSSRWEAVQDYEDILEGLPAGSRASFSRVAPPSPPGRRRRDRAPFHGAPAAPPADGWANLGVARPPVDGAAFDELARFLRVR